VIWPPARHQSTQRLAKASSGVLRGTNARVISPTRVYLQNHVVKAAPHHGGRRARSRHRRILGGHPATNRRRCSGGCNKHRPEEITPLEPASSEPCPGRRRRRAISTPCRKATANERRGAASVAWRDAAVKRCRVVLHRQSDRDSLIGSLPYAFPKSAANGRDRNAALLPIAALIFAVDHLEIQLEYPR